MNEANYSYPSKINLGNWVYERIIEMISNLELPLGSRINFSELEKKFQVSRGPLREALQQLTAKGLVTTTPRMGYYVIKLEKKDISDIFKIRLFIESECLKNSITRIPPEKIKYLLEIFESELQRAMVDPFAETTSVFCDADRVLHATLIVNSSEKKIFKQISSNIFEFIEITRHLHTRLKESSEEHIELLHAIEQQDINLALEVLENHFKNIEYKIVEAFVEKMGD